MICIRFIMAASLAALCGLPATAGAAAASEEIYVSTGEHGEVSFSDEAGPGAERVVLETTEPAEDPMAELERRIAQTLAVANALEEARQERAQARAAEAEARAQPQVVYQDRYVSSPYLYPRPFRPGRRHKPPHGPP